MEMKKAPYIICQQSGIFRIERKFDGATQKDEDIERCKILIFS